MHDALDIINVPPTPMKIPPLEISCANCGHSIKRFWNLIWLHEPPLGHGYYCFCLKPVPKSDTQEPPKKEINEVEGI